MHTRRSLLVALFLAPIVKLWPQLARKLPSSVVDLLSRHPNAAALHWISHRLSPFITPFVKKPGETRYLAQAIRQRSDGVLFYVNMVTPDFGDSDEGVMKWMAYRDMQICMAEAKFEQFRTCRCVVGRPCLKHSLEVAAA